MLVNLEKHHFQSSQWKSYRWGVVFGGDMSGRLLVGNWQHRATGNNVSFGSASGGWMGAAASGWMPATASDLPVVGGFRSTWSESSGRAKRINDEERPEVNLIWISIGGRQSNPIEDTRSQSLEYVGGLLDLESITRRVRTITEGRRRSFDPEIMSGGGDHPWLWYNVKRKEKDGKIVCFFIHMYAYVYSLNTSITNLVKIYYINLNWF